MKQGIRQSNAWLHGWSGLLLGWLLFAIFLTGTIAYFRQEVTLWMQPELHVSRPSPHAAEIGLARLAELAPDAQAWTVSLPTDRNNTLRISWRPAPEAGRGREGQGDEPAAAPRPQQRGGPQESRTLDATTGEVLAPRATAGGNFLYRFHFELYALPRDWARWIVGIATMAMFVAIISGIITHKKIFIDFFTFRPAKGQRSWLDAHNATAVLSLPFHIMITFSGLLLFTSTLLPYASEMIYGDNPRAAMRAAAERAGGGERVMVPMAAGPLVPIAPLLTQAEQVWGQPASRINVTNPGKPGAILELLPTRNDRLTLQSGSGGLGGVTMRFVAATGERLPSPEGRSLSAIAAIDTALGSLHRARFAEPALRWLFFLAGVGGTVMVGTGLVLWSVKRAEKAREAKLGFGHRLVDYLNVGAISGLCIAVAGYFWANRLIPATLADRAAWEINCFFILWGVTFLHPLVRPLKRAWIEQLVAAGALFALIPLLNAATTDSHLLATMPAGLWQVAGFDLVALLTGTTLVYTAWRLTRHKGRVKPARGQPVKGAPPVPAAAE